MNRRTRAGRALAGVAVIALSLGAASCAAGHDPRADERPGARGSSLTGPLAALLADSTDLGPSTRRHIAAVLALDGAARPASLERWAHRHRLQVAWHAGDAWAALSGPAAAMGAALHVQVDEYRSRSGHEFFAARRQPGVPRAVHGEVAQVGRLVDYSPHTEAAGHSAVDGLDPSQLITAYGADDVYRSAKDTTGTVVVFDWGPFHMSDLDEFTSASELPPLHPTVFGGDLRLANAADETELDLEVIHAVAPHARLVVADANPTFDGTTGASVGLAIARLFSSVDRQYPGAVWSLSIGWGCEQLYTRADLAPVESALERAESHGTTVFDASGDTAGLECKNNTDYSTPPGESDVGVDAVSSLPAVTSVGGTRLATDARGRWAAEEAWDYSSLSQGGSGGVSRLESRPPWQRAPGVGSLRGADSRLVPDVSADADPDTGVAIVIGGRHTEGGGTSQAAPIWAGFTALMDAYLTSHGGQPIGALNPLAYRLARGAAAPAFHDITLGGDAVDLTRPGYDLVTGLGSPRVDNLTQDLLALQRSGS